MDLTPTNRSHRTPGLALNLSKLRKSPFLLGIALAAHFGWTGLTLAQEAESSDTVVESGIEETSSEIESQSSVAESDGTAISSSATNTTARPGGASNPAPIRRPGTVVLPSSRSFPVPGRAATERGVTPNPSSSAVSTNTATAGSPSSAPATANTNITAAAGSNQAAPAEEETAILDLNVMELEQVLDIYQQHTEKTILRPSNLPNTTITLKTATPLTREEIVQALDSVLALNGITMIPRGEKFIVAVATNEAQQQAAAPTDASADELPEAGQYITKVVQLQHIIPSEIQPAIQPFSKAPDSILAFDETQTLVLRDYAINIKRMLEIIEKIDVYTPMDVELELIPIRYVQAEEIADVIGSLTTNGGSAGGRSGGSSSSFSRSRNNRSSSRSRTSNSMNPSSMGGRNTSMRSTPTAGGATGGTRSDLQQRLRGIINRATGDIQILGDAQIIPDLGSNSILVFANKRDMAMIKKIIEKLDSVQPQVLIEAIILEVTLNDSFNAGVSYSKSGLTAGDSTGAAIVNNGTPWADPSGLNNLTDIAGAAGNGFSYLGSIGNSFDVALNMASSDSKVNILSRPRIQTAHAQEASFFVGQTRPIVTGTFNNLSGNSSQYQQTEIGIELTVYPLINPEGLVVMEILQDVETLGEEVRIDNNDVPTTVLSSASATVAVRDRETIILGGFIQSTRNKSSSGVPWLRNIPILGNLFGSQSKDNTRRELIILIRPTVLETPEAAAVTATQEKNKLSGIREGEMEVMMDEQDRYRKSEKKIEKMQKQQEKDLELKP